MKGVCQASRLRSGWPHQVRLRKTGAAACVGRETVSLGLDVLSSHACGAAIPLGDKQVHRAWKRAQTYCAQGFWSLVLNDGLRDRVQDRKWDSEEC